jgi:hypothetical protein
VSTPQSPADVQTSVFSQLDSQDLATSNYVNSFPFGTSSSVMAGWINGLSGVIASYLRFLQESQWLWQQGLPGALERLDAKSADLSNAFNVYIETYNDTLNAERERGAIEQEAIQFGTYQALMANAYQVAVANEWVTGLNDVNENLCFDCHIRWQLPGFDYCLECARRRGLVAPGMS